MLMTNPEKRITPLEGLKHPFVKLWFISDS
jgi:hypothetical protein